MSSAYCVGSFLFKQFLSLLTKFFLSTSQNHPTLLLYSPPPSKILQQFFISQLFYLSLYLYNIISYNIALLQESTVSKFIKLHHPNSTLTPFDILQIEQYIFIFAISTLFRNIFSII